MNKFSMICLVIRQKYREEFQIKKSYWNSFLFYYYNSLKSGNLLVGAPQLSAPQSRKLNLKNVISLNRRVNCSSQYAVKWSLGDGYCKYMNVDIT